MTLENMTDTEIESPTPFDEQQDYSTLAKYGSSLKALQAFESGDGVRADALLRWDAQKNRPVEVDGIMWAGGTESAKALRDKRELFLKTNQRKMPFTSAEINEDGKKIVKILSISPDADNMIDGHYEPDEAENIAIKIAYRYETLRAERDAAL